MIYLTLIILFLIGYGVIIFEKSLNMHKAAVALVMGVVLWMLYFYGAPNAITSHEVTEKIADTAQIIFFLMAAMTIVELIDSHDGFAAITAKLQTHSVHKMLWMLLFISFFMSSVLDNLTSMIVMISLIRKLVDKQNQRWLLGSLVVISVNAGGAWTPIGDVTTTMLWIQERITTANTMLYLFLPSLANVVVSGVATGWLLRKEGGITLMSGSAKRAPMTTPASNWVLFMGVAALMMIPVLKALFGLPPFMGAMIGLGVMWLITDLMHLKYGQMREHLRVPHILRKIDTTAVLFFLGILLAVAALAQAGILRDFAKLLEKIVPNENYVAIVIGLISSIVDNVPLVAATFGMYDLATFPTDAPFWQLVAYAAGTGGSILIIGSAAGVAFMGIEKVDFFWYTKRFSLIALAGYVAGLIVYFLQTHFLSYI